MVLVFLGIMNYLIDAYTIFAASVLAANSVLRSIFGAVFPLFTTYMYEGLGIHWASSIPAFLAVACIPFPFLFYKYGPAIRTRCKYSAQSDQFMRSLQEQVKGQANEPEEDEQNYDRTEAPAPEMSDVSDVESTSREIHKMERKRSRAASRASARSNASKTPSTYEGNPYDIDRVNTRESFK